MNLRAWAPSLLCLLASCGAPTALVQTPSGRTIALETPEVMADGKVAVMGYGGYGTELSTISNDAAVFGGRIRLGVGREFELQFDGNLSANSYGINGEYRRLSPRVQGTGRFGVRYQLAEWFTASIGVALGGYDSGTLFGGDVGLNFGYENPYVVPFLLIRGSVQGPLGDQRIVFERQIASDTYQVAARVQAPATFFFSTTLGARVWLLPETERVRPSLLLGASWGFLLGFGTLYNPNVALSHSSMHLSAQAGLEFSFE